MSESPPDPLSPQQSRPQQFPPEQSPPEQSPPRAFTQGVGLVYQWFGVTLFLVMMFVCCASSLLSRDTATHSELSQIAVRLPGGKTYSAQQAVTLTVTLGVFFGIALAGFGLGMQAQNRRAPALALLVTAIATLFWIAQTLFFALAVHSLVLTVCCAGLSIVFALCAGLSIGAAREMRRNPPAPSFESLPEDYKIPYSHMHDDPPDVRYAAELEQRRKRLEVQQKELESLEERIRRRMKQSGD